MKDFLHECVSPVVHQWHFLSHIFKPKRRCVKSVSKTPHYVSLSHCFLLTWSQSGEILQAQRWRSCPLFWIAAPLPGAARALIHSSLLSSGTLSFCPHIKPSHYHLTFSFLLPPSFPSPTPYDTETEEEEKLQRWCERWWRVPGFRDSASHKRLQ